MLICCRSSGRAGRKALLPNFVDRKDDKNARTTAWMIKFNTPSSSGTFSAEADSQGVPPQFSYLFDIHQPAK